MILAVVKGHVVSTVKAPPLEGQKLLLVEILAATSEGLERAQKHMVCLAAMQAGAGALVTAVALTAAAGPLPQLSVLPRDSLWVEAPSQRNQQHQPNPAPAAAPRRAAPRGRRSFSFLPSSSFPQV